MNKLFLIAVCIMVGGCKLAVPKLSIKEKVDIHCGSEPRTKVLIMREVKPYVVFTEDGLVWVGLTPKGYENLSNNMVDIAEYIQQQRLVLRHYRECVEGFNSP